MTHELARAEGRSTASPSEPIARARLVVRGTVVWDLPAGEPRPSFRVTGVSIEGDSAAIALLGVEVGPRSADPDLPSLRGGPPPELPGRRGSPGGSILFAGLVLFVLLLLFLWLLVTPLGCCPGCLGCGESIRSLQMQLLSSFQRDGLTVDNLSLDPSGALTTTDFGLSLTPSSSATSLPPVPPPAACVENAPFSACVGPVGTGWYAVLFAPSGLAGNAFGLGGWSDPGTPVTDGDTISIVVESAMLGGGGEASVSAFGVGGFSVTGQATL